MTHEVAARIDNRGGDTHVDTARFLHVASDGMTLVINHS